MNSQQVELLAENDKAEELAEQYKKYIGVCIKVDYMKDGIWDAVVKDVKFNKIVKRKRGATKFLKKSVNRKCVGHLKHGFVFISHVPGSAETFEEYIPLLECRVRLLIPFRTFSVTAPLPAGPVGIVLEENLSDKHIYITSVVDDCELRKVDERVKVGSRLLRISNQGVTALADVQATIRRLREGSQAAASTKKVTWVFDNSRLEIEALKYSAAALPVRGGAYTDDLGYLLESSSDDDSDSDSADGNVAGAKDNRSPDAKVSRTSSEQFATDQSSAASAADSSSSSSSASPPAKTSKVGSLYSSLPQAPADQRPHWIIIDTDAGVDDAVAICVALKLQKSFSFKVVALTCSHGNTSLSNVLMNVRKCVDVCRAELPLTVDNDIVYKGANVALCGERETDASYWHGTDGLGDVKDIREPADVQINERLDAASAIVDFANRAERVGARLSVVAIGPMTNVATALKLDKDLCKKVELTIMGGCGNARGNITRVAEFNIYADVEAAKQVFRDWTTDITVVPWDVCVTYPLPWSDYSNLIGNKSDADGAVVGFLSKICMKNYTSSAGESDAAGEPVVRSLTGAVICDALAVCIAINNSVASKVEWVHVDVEDGSSHTRGMTVVDWGCYDGVKRTKNVKWVCGASVKKYAEMIKLAMEVKE